MPGDLSIRSMNSFMKKQLVLISISERPERIENAYLLYSYILTYFRHFMINFHTNQQLLNVLHKKCLEVIKDKTLRREKHLVNTCKSLLVELNKN